jgi:SAM-dependent methyltransferase
MKDEVLHDGFYRWYRKAGCEDGPPPPLKPDALSTSRYDDAARLLRGHEGGRLLDVACGCGDMVFSLVDRFDYLVGFDYTESRVNSANKKLHTHYGKYASKIEFRVASAEEHFPFEDKSFDAVITMCSLEFIGNVFLTMDEISRVCKPGGVLILCVRNACYIKDVAEMLFGQLPPTWRCSSRYNMAEWRELGGWKGGDLHLFNKASVCALLEHVGFTPEEWSGCGRLAKLRRWYLNLCNGITVRARRKA